MTSAAYGLIGGAFAFETAPFAVHPNDERRAYEYLEKAKEIGLTWTDVEADIKAYLKSKNADPTWAVRQLERAEGIFKSRLE
jgi:hypothetical protein